MIENITGECIEIGEVVNSTPPAKARIAVENLFQHILIVGSTGSGKTYTSSRIVNEVVSKSIDVKPIVIDWHGEYEGLLNKPIILSPFEHPLSIIDRRDLYGSLDLLVDSLELTPPQSYVLERVFREYGERISDLNDLIYYLENYIDESGWMRESRLSLLRKLSPLLRSRYVELFRETGYSFFKAMKHSSGAVLFNVSLIRDVLVRKTYVSLLLKKILVKAFSRETGRLLIVVEEAQNLIGRENPVKILSTMLSETRKFGIGLVIISQSPSRLLEEAMINTNTKIIHSVKSSIDLEVVNKVLYLPLNYQKIIPYLDVGEAVFYTRGLKKPVIVKVS